MKTTICETLNALRFMTVSLAWYYLLYPKSRYSPHIRILKHLPVLSFQTDKFFFESRKEVYQQKKKWTKYKAHKWLNNMYSWNIVVK